MKSVLLITLFSLPLAAEETGFTLPATDVMADAAAFNSKVKMLWLGIGTAEGDRFYKSVKAYNEALAGAGIKTVYYESPGTAHEWQTWRRCLREFAPLLFQPRAEP